MKPLHYKFSLFVINKYTTNETPMVSNWFAKNVHFGDGLPHRYQAKMSDYFETKSKERVCIYCLKPESFMKEVG